MKEIAFAIAALMASTSTVAQSGDDLTPLRQAMRQLQERIDALEKGASGPKAQGTSNVVVQGEIPRSWRLPGTETSIAVGGQVAATAIVSSRGGATSQADTSLVAVAIRLDDAVGVRKRYWKLNAQESMLRVRTHTPTGWGPLTSLIEGDFYGQGGTELGTNGHGFRLRHAWFTIGRFAAGQYWSNALNLTAYPESVFYGADIGTFNALRQTGFRYTHPVDAATFWSVSLENPESVVTVDASNNGAATTPDNDRLPDITGKVHFAAGGGQFEVAALARRITSAPGAMQASRWGYGGAVSGFVPFGARDRVSFVLSASRGSGRQLGGLVPDVVATGPRLDGVATLAGLISFKHYWSERLRSNLTYSWIAVDYPAGLSMGTAAGSNRAFRSGLVNLFWAATPQVELGVEALHVSRQVETGKRGSLSRYHFISKYVF